MSIKKFVEFWIVGSVISLYTTFVIQSLWNWFATSALHVSGISFWGMYGLVLLIGLFANKYGQNLGEEQRWKDMLTALDACIPDDKREVVKEQLEELKEGIRVEAGTTAFGTLVGNTFVLALGFVVHVFVASRM
jgi:hypothetical protein